MLADAVGRHRGDAGVLRLDLRTIAEDEQWPCYQAGLHIATDPNPIERLWLNLKERASSRPPDRRLRHRRRRLGRYDPRHFDATV
jgi:hypothetical protein